MTMKNQGSGHEGQNKGGQQGGGNIKNDPQRASEAGKKGGEHSSGGMRDQHVKSGQQSPKSK